MVKTFDCQVTQGKHWLGFGFTELGFVEVRQRGSHKQFRHDDGRATTIPFHGSRDISPLLLRQIALDIGLTLDELLSNR